MNAARASQAGFERLLEAHGGIIRKVAFGYTNSAADREDLAQEIALQLSRAWPRYSPERPFSTWMYRIALNIAISSLRRRSRHTGLTIPLEEHSAEVAAPAAPPNERDERVAMLQQVIAALAPLDRALLLLYLEEKSYRDIAAILGLTETNVATKLNRLKQRVREEMLKRNRQNS